MRPALVELAAAAELASARSLRLLAASDGNLEHALAVARTLGSPAALRCSR